MDLKPLTDDELSEHLNAVLAERERRQALTTIPDQIRDLTAKYVDGGGNAEDLIQLDPGTPWGELPGEPV